MSRYDRKDKYRAKLIKGKLWTVCALYKTCKYTQAELAKAYDISNEGMRIRLKAALGAPTMKRIKDARHKQALVNIYGKVPDFKAMKLRNERCAQVQAGERWSIKHTACVMCKETAFPHKAHGACASCIERYKKAHPAKYKK